MKVMRDYLLQNLCPMRHLQNISSIVRFSYIYASNHLYMPRTFIVLYLRFVLYLRHVPWIGSNCGFPASIWSAFIFVFFEKVSVSSSKNAFSVYLIHLVHNRVSFEYWLRGSTTNEMGNAVKSSFICCASSRILYKQRTGTLSWSECLQNSLWWCKN